MLKKVNNTTLALIKNRAIPQTNIICPITSNDIDILFDWFEMEEITLSNAKADNEHIDTVYFHAVCVAVNDLLTTDEEAIDLDDLNRRLEQIST